MTRPTAKYLPKMLKSILLAGTCSAAMLAQSPVLAQTDQADQQADADDMVLEEVVVTTLQPTTQETDP
jgi:hypothetical protein